MAKNQRISVPALDNFDLLSFDEKINIKAAFQRAIISKKLNKQDVVDVALKNNVPVFAYTDTNSLFWIEKDGVRLNGAVEQYYNSAKRTELIKNAQIPKEYYSKMTFFLTV